MPLADHEAQKEYMRRRYRERYASDPKFRLAEAKRKARHYAENPAYQRRVKKKVAKRGRRRRRSASPAAASVAAPEPQLVYGADWTPDGFRPHFAGSVDFDKTTSNHAALDIC
jgi:hypothetical protein